MKKQADSWLQSAYSDLSVIEEIVEREDLSHMVAFHSQQVIEKCFKAVLEEFEIELQRTHNIIVLSNKVIDVLDITVDETLIKQLNDLYIDSRYPTDIGFLPDGKPTIEVAKRFYRYAKQIFNEIANQMNT